MVRIKSVAAAVCGAFSLVVLVAGAAQAGHHQTRGVLAIEETVSEGPYTPTGGPYQTHSVPVEEETVSGGPYKPHSVPVTEERVSGGPYAPTSALDNPGPLG
ncbi:hypothetical protein ACIBAI_00385 [Streptomyces sp. NPDC051041]|uniref:hypothetical protein n=1 Tax=Streptomyces sp. NPDC051041 TaxID=3365640 RepID=UPI0037AB69BC